MSDQFQSVKQSLIDEITIVSTFKTASDFPKLIRKTMEIVEKTDKINFTGPEKRQLVIDLVTYIVDKTDMCDVLLPMIPVMIDQFIDINDGNLEINKKLKGKFWCCA